MECFEIIQRIFLKNISNLSKCSGSISWKRKGHKIKYTGFQLCLYTGNKPKQIHNQKRLPSGTCDWLIDDFITYNIK